MEEKIGVTAAAPMAFAAAPAGGGAAAVEEKTEFDVILTSVVNLRRSEDLEGRRRCNRASA